MAFFAYVITVASLLYTDFQSASIDWVDVVSSTILYIISNLLITITTILPHRIHYKWFEFNRLINSIENDLDYGQYEKSTRTSKLMRKYSRQATAVVIITLICFLPRMFLQRHDVHWVSELAYLHFRIYKYAVTLHILFYAHVINAILVDLAEFPVIDCNHFIEAHFAGRNVLKSFARYKNIHYKICAAINLVNDIFGWSIVLLVVLTMADFTYICYWMFYLLNRDEAIYALRMYLHTLCENLNHKLIFCSTQNF